MVAGDSVNELAKAIADLFCGGLRGERIDGAWPCVFSGVQEVTGLGRRVASVEAEFHGLLRKRLGRVGEARIGGQAAARAGAGPVCLVHGFRQRVRRPVRLHEWALQDGRR